MLSQIAVFIVDTLFTFFVFLLLLRFHFQWLRVPFRNPVGQFVLATTNWMVVPARRVVPGLAGLDLGTLILAWLIQALGLWLKLLLVGAEPALGMLAMVAALDLLRYSIYILMVALIVQAVMSWVNPYTPLAPVFDAATRPFLGPLRRFVPPLGGVDITPLVLLVLLQIVLFILAEL
jgi:YggT family protein